MIKTVQVQSTVGCAAGGFKLPLLAPVSGVSGLNIVRFGGHTAPATRTGKRPLQGMGNSEEVS